jgi:endonuclease III
MTKKQLQIRSRRVALMNVVLRELFPVSTIALVHSSTWELLVAVILSAQCTDKRVNEVTKELFAKYRTLEDYASASQEDMERAVFRCGFYRNKAKHIRGSAQRIIHEYGGVVPDTMDELLTLPGVARKTANVVLSNAFHKEEGIAVDTHVRRFSLRFDLTDFTDPRQIEGDLMQIMPQNEWWGFNHRLVEYGRAFCPARPHECLDHPHKDIPESSYLLAQGPLLEHTLL